MSQEDDNKAVFHRWFGEAWNSGNFDVAYEVIAPQMRVHGAGGQPVQMGPDGLIGLIKAWRDAFPDGHMDVSGLIAEGDLVAALLTWHGTQQGDFYGVPASGKPVVCTSIGIDRVVDGIIVDGWGELDMLGLMQQIGAAPAVGPGATAAGQSAEWGTEDQAAPDAVAGPADTKPLATAFVTALNAGTRDAFAAIVDGARYVEHSPIWGATDFAGLVATQEMLRAALPDLQYTADHGIVIAEGDQVALHLVATGTHTGAELFGAPAHGEAIAWSQTDLLRVAGGKIVERWDSADTLAIWKQASAAPAGAA